MEEAQNVFQRAAAKPTLQADRQNRFALNDEQRTAEREKRQKEDLKARIERNKTQRSSWVGDGRKQTSAVGSTTLDRTTAELKRASDVSREELRHPKVEPQAELLTPTTFAAIVLQWERNHPEYASTPFNDENMSRALTEALAKGCAFSYEALDDVYAYLRANNFIEPKAGPRKRGEFVLRSAPREYPKFVTDAARDAEKQAQRDAATVQDAENVEAARSMSFTELAKIVRSGFKNLHRAPEVF